MWQHVWTASQFVLAQGGGDAPVDGAAKNPMGSMWLFIIAFLAIMWFFMLRPQQKREKLRRDMLSSLGKGDRVVTTGGIHGNIVGLTERSVVLRVSDEPAVKMEFLRGSIASKVDEEERS